MTSELLRKVWKAKNLEDSWRVIQENGRASSSESVRAELQEFAQDAPRRLRSLQGRLVKGSFSFGAARGVKIPKLDSKGRKTGKIRPIVLASVEARIVQRALLNVLLEIEALKPFAENPYSFGGIRGERRKSSVSRTPGTTRSEEPAAVPAAIKAILEAIGRGGRFYAAADIQAFFTKIPKSKVITIISSAVGDEEFIKFLKTAIEVELSNLAELRQHASEFPIEDIGVAQGNSLSPLLGNILLADFDAVMNEGDCTCIRYIDDFLIIAPSLKAANARLKKAKDILEKFSMALSPEKSSAGGKDIREGFDFLGIRLVPGLIRPAPKAQAKFLTSIDATIEKTVKAFRGFENGHSLDSADSLTATLRRLDGAINGWGKHYWFCNDNQFMAAIDAQLAERVRGLLGIYSDMRLRLPPEKRSALLGVAQLVSAAREPFQYPKQKAV